MKVFNSLSSKFEQFKPLDAHRVKMYVCGITPYDTTHFGHAFLYVFFDAVYRYLQHKGFEVMYTQNVTDIDDDILKRAKAEKRDWQELGDFWTNKFLTDLKSLNVLMPTHYVKATDSIPSIIRIIEEITQKGFAYKRNGNVYFEVKKFKNYGKLSKFTKEQMIKLSKERGADPKDPNKKDPLDFLLWQRSKKDEPSWSSQWSQGRPGWHIECSAMIYDTLGEQIDIHGGGQDLIYPHHESEIAQSESFSGKKPFVNYWMHASMVMYKGEKMSKSLGNLIMVFDLLKKYSPNAIRWVLLSHHYRSAWEFKESELKNAEKIIKSLTKKIHKKEVSASRTIEKHIENDFDFPAVLKSLEKESPEIIKFYLNLLGFVV